METTLIGLIIMQITLVPDSVTPGCFFWPAILNGRHFPIWRKPAIFKFLNFYNMVVIFKPNKSAIFKFIIARFEPHLR